MVWVVINIRLGEIPVKNRIWIIIGTIALLIIAAVAYFHVTGLIDSLYVYRSPLHDAPPAPAPALGQPLTRRVVVFWSMPCGMIPPKRVMSCRF